MQYSPEELEEVLKNDVAFELFFNSLDRVKNLKGFQEGLRNGNEQFARKYSLLYYYYYYYYNYYY
jgi:hypothetical protein